MSCRYSMVIQWSNEDQVFVVTLPEFPHCQTHGTTYEEAVKNGQEVLDLLIETFQAEGRALPEPETLETSPDFWQLLEERRGKMPTVPSPEFGAELGAEAHCGGHQETKVGDSAEPRS